MWRAEQLGGSEHFGWDHNSYLAADQVDAVKALISIKAHSGKRGPVKFEDPVYRPKPKDVKTEIETPVPDTSLDNFNVQALVAQMGIS